MTLRLPHYGWWVQFGEINREVMDVRHLHGDIAKLHNQAKYNIGAQEERPAQKCFFFCETSKGQMENQPSTIQHETAEATLNLSMHKYEWVRENRKINMVILSFPVTTNWLRQTFQLGRNGLFPTQRALVLSLVLYIVHRWVKGQNSIMAKNSGLPAWFISLFYKKKKKKKKKKNCGIAQHHRQSIFIIQTKLP